MTIRNLRSFEYLTSTTIFTLDLCEIFLDLVRSLAFPQGILSTPVAASESWLSLPEVN